MWGGGVEDSGGSIVIETSGVFKISILVSETYQCVGWEGGVWEGGVWCVGCGVWRVTCGVWPATLHRVNEASNGSQRLGPAR